MIVRILSHTEDKFLFMVQIQGQEEEEWVPLSTIKDSEVFKAYLETLTPVRRERLVNALESQESLPKPATIELEDTQEESKDEPTESTPIKRPRGRPRKIKPSESSEINPGNTHPSSDTEASSQPDPATPKRGRGRPPKPKPDLKDSGADSSTDPDPPKRPRGRPRKSGSNSQPSSPVVSKKKKDSSEATRRTLRDRTKKSSDIDDHLDDSSEDAEPELDLSSSSSSNDEDPSPVVVKRGRGRPRKRPLNEIQPTTTSAEPAVKRGRGRPKKIQKSSSEQVIASPTKIKLPRGRPRKYDRISGTKLANSEHSGEPTSLKSTPGSSKLQKKLKHQQDDAKIASRSHPDSPVSFEDSDAVYLSDSEEELGFFTDSSNPNSPQLSKAVKSNGQTRSCTTPSRFKQFSRENRVYSMNTNKVLIPEERVECLSSNQGSKLKSLSSKQQQIFYALKAYLPSIDLIKHTNSLEILCPACSGRTCHRYCRLQLLMELIRSTLDWMQTNDWPNLPELSANDLEFPSRFQESIQEFQKSLGELDFPSKWSEYASGSNGEIPELLKKYHSIFVYFARKLRISQIHSIRFQKALFRLERFQFSLMNLDDIELLYKLVFLVAQVDDSSVDIYQAWSELPRSDEDELPERVKNHPLKVLLDFLDELQTIQSRQTKNQISLDRSDASEEQLRDLWGINLQYVENASYLPKADENKCALYCCVVSRQEPSHVARTLLKRLDKDMSLDCEEHDESVSAHGQQIAAYSALDSRSGDRITCTADNWAGKNDIHLFIRIESSNVSRVVDLIQKEISKQFRLDDAEKYIAVLRYNHFETDVGDLHLSVTTGEGELSSSSPDVAKNPSTLCVATKNGEEVLRCLLTYSHNFETYVNGPTIQILSVNSAYRNSSIGSTFLQWLETDFLSFWKPKAPSIDVFISYVTNAHGFFVKNGYEFYDFFNEEARKTIRRPKLVKAKKDQNGQTSLDEHIADVMEETKPELEPEPEPELKPDVMEETKPEPEPEPEPEPSDTTMQDIDPPVQQNTVSQEQIAEQPEAPVDAMSED